MPRLSGLWKRSLMARLVSYFLLLSLLTLGLVAGAVYLRATDSLKQSVFDRLDGVISLKEDSFNRWIDDQSRSILFFSYQPEVQAQAAVLLDPAAGDAQRQAAYDYLSADVNRIVTSISDWDELYILDLSGKVVLSTHRADEGSSAADAAYFQQGRRMTYVQPVSTSPLSGSPVMTMATPLLDSSKRVVGVLAGNLKLGRIDQIILQRSGLGESGETYLVDPSFHFVSAALYGLQSNPNTVYHSAGIDAVLQKRDGQGLYANYQGQPVIGMYRWLPNAGVALVAEISQAEAFAPARALAVTIFWIGLASALVLGGGVYLLARQIARPILVITRAASQVAAGDLSQTAPVTTEDEVGVLARAFNQMTAELRLLYEGLERKVAERTADLTSANQRLQDEVHERERAEAALVRQNEYLAALHTTALGLISRLDLDELLDLLVTRAVTLLDCPGGFVYLEDETGATLELRVARGASGVFARRLARGEGLSGRIWQSGETLAIQDYNAWEGRSAQISPGLFQSLAGAPLKSGRQTVGVLGLARDGRSGGAGFAPAEIELLNRFAQLASIAIDNARLYAAAQEARAAAEAANESKSAFLANVSHELRTPLTSILGFARIVQKRLAERILPALPAGEARAQKAAAQIDENLAIILSEGQRLTALINNVLDLEKIQAGKMEWRMQPLDLREVILQAGAATASLFEGKGLALFEDIPAGLPQVLGDHDKLVQVVINLYSNAVKFTSQGTVTCRVRAAQRELRVSVSDQGIGIAWADQEAVFEKFKQIGDTLTDKPKGTGLGLPICREIVQHHGGRIWVESEPGVGSTFTFSLPVEPAAALQVPPPPAPALDVQTLLQQLKPRMALPVPGEAPSRAILVVDDDPSIRELLRQSLEAEGYRVFLAGDGRAALDEARRIRPDLILLDVMMPGLNGFEVTAVLKSDPETMNLPVMIVSVVEDRERGARLGVDHYLTKPIDLPALLASVGRLLAQGAARKRVLVADEDAGAAQSLAEALQAQDYQVLTAASAEEALSRAADLPDLVILNAQLSAQHDLARRLRQVKGLENVVVLLVK